MAGEIEIDPTSLAKVREILCATIPSSAKVWVFGSRANHTAKPYSDLDLAIELPNCEKLDAKALIDLETAFEESTLAWKVDVIDYNNVDENFQRIICNNKVELKFT